jgi:hypothetical protein
MTRETKRIKVSKTQFSQYKKIADGFFGGAVNEKELGNWNSAGVLIIHAAIGYADAVTIKYGGVRSKGDDHQDIVRRLDNLLPQSEAKKSALNQLEKLIAHKTSVSYSGEEYDYKDIEKLFKHLERFRSWVEKQIDD